jgi:hypothetical protein
MEIKNIKAIRPRFNYIITTADETDFTAIKPPINSSIIQSLDGEPLNKVNTKVVTLGEFGNGLHSYQRVIAVGSFVKDINVGDIVKINLTKYAQMKYEEGSIKGSIQDMNSVISYNVPKIKLNGVDYLKLADNDVDFIVADYEGKELQKSEKSEKSEEDIKSETDSNESPDKTSD